MILSYFALNGVSKDGKLILLARIIRTFAYGFLSIVLAVYLKINGFNDSSNRDNSFIYTN